MKVTILGTSNAWGPNQFLNPPPQWPMAGVLTTGARVTFRKYRTSLLVESADGKKILVDCGPDFSHQLREFRFGVVDAILLTHPHFDHIGGLIEISLYRPTGCLPIPTYATEACWNSIKHERGLRYVVDSMKLVLEHNLSFDPHHRSFSIGTVKVTPFRIEHQVNAPGSAGFVFEESTAGQTKRVLYTGDLWAFSDPADLLFCQQFDVVIMECDRWDGRVGPDEGGGHMSFEEVMRVLNSGALSDPKPKQLVVVHFGDNGPRGHASSYQDWRDCIIEGLAKNGLKSVMPDQDVVIGYEGLTV